MPRVRRTIPLALTCWAAILAASGAAAQALVTYTLPDGHLYRIEAEAGATPEDVGAALDLLAPGSDEWLNTSPDGSWLLVSSERFDPRCSGWPCLALVAGDLSSGAVVEIAADVVHADSFGAVASDGDTVVWPGTDGPHTVDLFAAHRSGGAWGPAITLTAASSFEYHTQPAISDDGSRVVFDCSGEPYTHASVCEVGTDGSGFRVVIGPLDGPGGSAANSLHHPDHAPAGGIVFEADWEGEQIWRLTAGATTPERVTAQFNNDNSPCVLADGRIASLWLDRPGGNGDHELKLMAADGSAYLMLLMDTDILDGGLGCAVRASATIFADGFEDAGTGAWTATVW